MSETPQKQSRLAQALLVVGGLLALMWALEGLDTVTANALDNFGIEPRQLSDLPNILWAPLLHFGWPHLISNSIPFLVLGVITYLSGPVKWLVTTVISAIFSGLAAWLLSPIGTITAGVSGVIFGYLTYLLVRGIFSRKIGQILISLVVFVLYGSVLLGVLPGTPGVSWLAHLGGAVGGVIAAWLLHNRSRDARPQQMAY
ncbi:rhomboid family intramembrane serine protease [Tessaracoccus flavescens]|uniref:Rhomboid family intramembrane serine protease n=1 Tax=Tessaracoccus flavescens TaxID=399497 RepID=A0A1Q2CZ97_9ACTN|nr:rhomboid family intramembrane serine protease [Tessaracoccus flavescens]AQP51450.1 rhomboid family intramembrane serine protease [Tessaracoccus flavescens]